MYEPGRVLKVEFYKYPEGRPHYWWEARVVEVRREGSAQGGGMGVAVLVHAPAGFVFHHETKGIVTTVDHHAYVAFFEGRWYSGGPDVDRGGEVVGYYWNVQTPPVFEGSRIWQYDLELDVRCTPELACEACDAAEFEARRRLYPEAWARAALSAVEEIREHVRRARWPVRRPWAPLS